MILNSDGVVFIPPGRDQKEYSAGWNLSCNSVVRLADEIFYIESSRNLGFHEILLRYSAEKIPPPLQAYAQQEKEAGWLETSAHTPWNRGEYP